ncbi:hypothetical protein M2132_001821 [Dysgonomonas sp. PH5-45]|uniref:hypothetical protein n=1 Tax=unclassified Dysgonomonas TaxID=2630389 RepID=UPI0024754A3F|nr:MULTISPECIES: hypothetical protein [unclassified Dysgonomonas]MDH6355478.1 hypothetical protein [Dysgonomonas sp. PH5-45]MDH6388374.1 hypothetical protein [Dysgonomonas sp. PH5-37]
MATTIEELLQDAITIKEETATGANTAERVGGWMEDATNILTPKINENGTPVVYVDEDNPISDSMLSGLTIRKSIYTSLSGFISSLNTYTNYWELGGKTITRASVNSRPTFLVISNLNDNGTNRVSQIVIGNLTIGTDGNLSNVYSPDSNIIYRKSAPGAFDTWESWKYLTKGDTDIFTSLTSLQEDKADKLNGDNAPVVYHDFINPVFEGFIDTPIQKVGADGTFEGIYYSTASRCFGARINNDGNVVYTNVIPGDDVTFTYYNTKDVFGTDRPYPNKVYSCGDRLYLWNGTDLIEAFNSARFERRIAFVTELTENILPIGEAMTIYKATGKNLLKLEVKPNDSSTNWTNIPLDADTSIDLSAMLPTDALLRVTRNTIDSVATVYLFTRVNQ